MRIGVRPVLASAQRVELLATGGPAAPAAWAPSDLRRQLATRSEQLLERARTLRADKRYPELPSLVLKPIEASWPEIEALNTELLDRAGGLDDTEAALKVEMVGLEERGKAVDAVTHTHNGSIEDWNRDCAGERPRPVYEQCVSRWASLEPILNAHLETMRVHNEQVVAFNEKGRSFQESVAGLNEKFHEWARKIIDLIERIGAFLAASPGTMVCSWTEQRIPPENGVCIYDCFEPDGHGGWIDHPGIAIPAQTEGDPCPSRLDFVPVPRTGV